MAKKKNRRRARSPIAIAVSIVLILFAYVFCCAVDFYNIDIGVDIKLPGYNVFELFAPKQTIGNETPTVPQSGEVYFHFIDVGQGDAILVTTPEGNMLIDTSVSGVRKDLDLYLRGAGVGTLKYLVLTHPDADHIGNADYIIDNYEIENIIMTDRAATSKTYERLLDAIERSTANVILAEAGYKFELGALVNTILAPVKSYDDSNEMSIVIKSVYGNTSVMLTGDAERESEADALKKWSADTFKCDILKVGHHGSTSSTTANFLNAVDPDIAIISCGEDNSYGHPHDEIVERLEAKGIKIYRTDIDGDIVFKTDGNNLTLVENGQ